MPALEVIRGLKGTLDFYYWRGLPYVRKWPQTPRAHLTQGTLAAAAIFTAIIQGYALLGGKVKTLFQEAAADQPRTGRDLYVTATYGHLHESSMSEITDLITEANVLLTTLVELTNALKSNDADRLIVRAEDQLFSYKETLVKSTYDTLSSDNGHIKTPTVPPGVVWAVTNTCFWNTDRATTGLNLMAYAAATYVYFDAATRAIAQEERVSWQGSIIIPPGGHLRAYNPGGLSGDNAYFQILGHVMSLEL